MIAYSKKVNEQCKYCILCLSLQRKNCQVGFTFKVYGLVGENSNSKLYSVNGFEIERTLTE